MRSEMQTEKVYALSEKDAGEKIIERNRDKKNLVIFSVIPVPGHADSGYEVKFAYDTYENEIKMPVSEGVSDEKKPYVCSVCGKQGVKLWRPYNNTEPLICAVCAEERQTHLDYDQYIWHKEGDRYVGVRTEPVLKLPLPRWKVDENGKVPSFQGPDHNGEFLPVIDQLIVNLRDVSKAYSSGETNMMPAVPDEDGNYWGYTSVPEDRCEWWRQLPTR